MMIQKLKHNRIDKKKWDETITHSGNPHVYALSWYLDIVSPGWECLMLNNYEVVMPLPVKRKWGIPYLVQPLFCQKLALYGNEIKDETRESFYAKLYKSFPYLNVSVENISGLKTNNYKERTNYTLDLGPLEINFSDNTSRNIKKATDAQVKPSDCSASEFRLFCRNYLKGLGPFEFEVFESLVDESLKQGIAHLIKSTDDKGETLAVACFLIWNRQIVYLSGASSPLGKELSAMFTIFNSIIKEYSGTGYLLDFEGSMIPGVARFFKGFGAKASSYYHVKKMIVVRH